MPPLMKLHISTQQLPLLKAQQPRQALRDVKQLPRQFARVQVVPNDYKKLLAESDEEDLDEQEEWMSPPNESVADKPAEKPNRRGIKPWGKMFLTLQAIHGV